MYSLYMGLYFLKLKIMSNSIGDLKNSGLQGNNWPWQYKVLLGLDKIVSAIGATEYEAQIIKATCPGPVPASGYYLEVRIYNPTTGTFGAPVYYLPGSTTPVNLSACTKEYANDSLVLTQILTELQDQGLTLDAIETAVEGTLTVQATDLDIRDLTCDDKVSLCVNGNIVDALNPLPTTASVTFPTGSITACDDAVAITFCDTLLTEFLAQGTALDDILTAVTGTLDVNVTNIVDVSGSNVLVTGTVAVSGISDGSDSLEINTDGSINVNATIVGPIGNQDCDNSLAVSLCSAQAQDLTDIKNAVEGTLTVGGTVAVTQSTSPWIVNTNSVVRVPSILRTTGGLSIPPGARSFSILNAGSGTASILGGTNNLLPGEEVDFVAGGNDSFGLINFNGNGVTTLVVTYVS
jgi:hypothetical protein